MKTSSLSSISKQAATKPKGDYADAGASKAAATSLAAPIPASKKLIWSPPPPELESVLVDSVVVQLALDEDIRRGDPTSNLCIEPGRIIVGEIVVKQSTVIAGLDVLESVFKQVDAKIKVEKLLHDGDTVTVPPSSVATLRGPARAVLGAERTALNFLQHLCGVATLTRKFADRVSATKIKILDTRKTTPGLRSLEKYAVAVGGGTNHRFSLSDAILIKDNHIAVAGSIAGAVNMVRDNEPAAKVEVEVKTLQEVQEAVDCKAEMLMFDNMSPDMVRSSLKLVPDGCFVELSGGINLNNIDSYLIEGVDAISIGALTHSAPSIDISLEIGDFGNSLELKL